MMLRNNLIKRLVLSRALNIDIWDELVSILIFQGCLTKLLYLWSINLYWVCPVLACTFIAQTLDYWGLTSIWQPSQLIHGFISVKLKLWFAWLQNLAEASTCWEHSHSQIHSIGLHNYFEDLTWESHHCNHDFLNRLLETTV